MTLAVLNEAINWSKGNPVSVGDNVTATKSFKSVSKGLRGRVSSVTDNSFTVKWSGGQRTTHTSTKGLRLEQRQYQRTYGHGIRFRRRRVRKPKNGNGTGTGTGGGTGTGTGGGGGAGAGTGTGGGTGGNGGGGGASEESLHERYAGAKYERGIWYHGTDFKNFRAIRKKGLIPDPKVRAWAEDPGSSFSMPSRASLGGIYVTTNLMTAKASAPGTPGSQNLIVILSLQPRSMWADEDSVTHWMNDISQPGMVANEYMIASIYMSWKYGDRRLKLYAKKSRDHYIAETSKWIMKDIEGVHPKLRARLKVLLKQAWGLGLTRKGAYIGTRTWKSAYSQVRPDVDWNDIPGPPDKAKAEKNYAVIIDKVTRTMKRGLLPSVAPQVFNRTARIMKPVAFKGKNRIVAMVRYWRDPESGKSREEVVYGKVPPKFVKDWTTAVGEWVPERKTLAASFDTLSNLYEEEPGGDQPTDMSAAKRLASTALKNKAATALSFRQLWRHKYVKNNYDASQAWKLFYWPLTHAGAGGKGYNPNTRKAASKIMVGAFNKWASAGMKAKVKRSDGMKELPVGQISKDEFVKWFNGGGRTTESLDEAYKVGDETPIGKIVGLHASGTFKVLMPGSKFPQLLKADDIDFEIKKAKSNKAFRAKQTAAAGVKQAATSKRDNTHGFLDGIKSKALRGRASKYLLQRNIRWRGKVHRHKEFVEALYKAGHTPETNQHKLKYLAVGKDDTFLKLDKTAYDYLTHLRKVKAKLSESSTAQVDPSTEKRDNAMHRREENAWLKKMAKFPAKPKPGMKFWVHWANGIGLASFTTKAKMVGWMKGLMKKEAGIADVSSIWHGTRDKKKVLQREFLDEAVKAPKATAKNTRLRTATAADKKINMTCSKCVYWNKDTTDCTALGIKVKPAQLCDLYAWYVDKMTPKRKKKLVGYFTTPIGKLAVVGDPEKLYSVPVDEALKSRRPPHLQNLLDIENGLGIYSNINVPGYVSKDAGKLYDAIKKGDKKVALKILLKHQAQMTKGGVQGGPKQVKVGSAPRSAIARAANAFLAYGSKMESLDEIVNPADFEEMNNYVNKLARAINRKDKNVLINLFTAKKPSSDRYAGQYIPRQTKWSVMSRDSGAFSSKYWIEGIVDVCEEVLNLPRDATHKAIKQAQERAAAEKITYYVVLGKDGITITDKHPDPTPEFYISVSWDGELQFLTREDGQSYPTALDPKGRNHSMAQPVAVEVVNPAWHAAKQYSGASFSTYFGRRYKDPLSRARVRVKKKPKSLTPNVIDTRRTAGEVATVGRYEPFIEGINDDYLFKAVFLAGGPGAGKSFIAEQMFSGMGVRFVNPDTSFEFLLTRAKLPLAMADPKTEPELEKKQQAQRMIAKTLSKKRQGLWINGMLPLVIDGTGKNVKKIARQKKALEGYGYDTAIVFVNTTLEVAQARNLKRARKVRPAMLKASWQSVQNNIGKFQSMFGASNFMVVDNSEMLDKKGVVKVGTKLRKAALKMLQKPLINPHGKLAVQILRKSGGKTLRDLPVGGAEKLAANYDRVSNLSELFLSHGSMPRISAPGLGRAGPNRAGNLVFPGQEPQKGRRKRRRAPGSTYEGAHKPSTPNNNGTSRDAQKAEKEDFDIDDIQLFYDLQIAGTANRQEAIRNTKKKFKITTLEVNPAGRVAVKGMEKPTPPAPPPVPMAAPGGGGGALPPEPEPEPAPEPKPAAGSAPKAKPMVKKKEESREDERPNTRTVGAGPSGMPFVPTGPQFWRGKKAFRRQATPIVRERGSIKRDSASEPIRKALYKRSARRYSLSI